MRNILKRAFAFCLILAVVSVMTACGDNDENKGDTGAAGTDSIVITGSSSAAGLVKALGNDFKEEYKDKYPDLEFKITDEDSGSAIDAVRSGKADIGLVSRAVTDEEKSLVDDVEVFAMDGIAVIANKNCNIENLTVSQAKKIFSGQIVNWSDVGGENTIINVYSREESSGTRNEFLNLLGLNSIFDTTKEKKLTDRATVYNSSEEVKKAVAGDKSGIGYISMTALDKTVKDIAVDDVKINAQNVGDENYKLVRNFSFVIAKDESEAADDFIDWVLSAKGQQAVEAAGYVPIK
ncbi:MAG: phosphate ABC transporter substrate-binding protein [Anaerovoracaceae bacterium]|nr:phosphate ABC transporter substrate-binding protein [Clostridiales bacterium]MDY2934565.1 phosphate ABC transporter substrate-binding protein [Anaerovoracaceae bacterium]